MKEAAITQSPHAFVPKKDLTEQEREELYRTRLDESFRPYTVIDVITKVYHRSFEDDLKTYIGEHSEEFKTTSDEWSVDRIWVNELRIIRPESVFGQPVEDFLVDIAVEAKIRLEETRRISAAFRNSYKLNLQIVAVCIALHLPPETVPLVLFILCKEVFQLLQETFRDRRESLISVPYYIQRSFNRGLQGAEHKAAPGQKRIYCRKTGMTLPA